VPAAARGQEVAIVGGGLAGLIAGYELMKMGLKPVIYEQGRLGGRLRSQAIQGAEGVIAELGAMRFPVSSKGFRHYLDLCGLQTKPFPNPLDDASPSTVIDLEGEVMYVEPGDQLPKLLREVEDAWAAALEWSANNAALRTAIAARDIKTVKEIWNELIPLWDERTFYDFIASSPSFQALSFRHREVFGQVGFGTGGWDSDFPNSMLEILRVVVTGLDDDQHLVEGGVEQLPRRLWTATVDGVSLSTLHGGAPRPGVTRLARASGDRFAVTDRWGDTRLYPAVLTTCQSWLLTTSVNCDESLFSHKMWMAFDRTRYMQSSKTFVMVDRPFWLERDEKTGRYPFSTTLSDRLTRGTYLFDNGPDKPAVICLSYSWMSDAMKVLPLSADQRVNLMLSALKGIYPDLDLKSHIVGDPITVSWEDDPGFLGAFKGALPGHYRYNRRMYCHFMQGEMPPAERGIFVAGDDISWTPGWVEGAVHTALNAVWGIMHHFGGATHPDNPGPGDLFHQLAPLALAD
jgi:monoamine oxidase